MGKYIAKQINACIVHSIFYNIINEYDDYINIYATVWLCDFLLGVMCIIGTTHEITWNIYFIVYVNFNYDYDYTSFRVIQSYSWIQRFLNVWFRV